MEYFMNSRSEVVSEFFAPGVNFLDDNVNVDHEPCSVGSLRSSVAEDYLELAYELNRLLSSFRRPPLVDYVYNATEYARLTFEMYVRRYCGTMKQIMILGMNPGPWGMSQTGVPFGEVSMVRDWLGIEGPVGKPMRELSTRLVTGFNCQRSEISGKRFWDLFKDLCGDPENFFRTSFVYNYLPEQWMKSNGCNVTPPDFKSSEMEPLYEICDPMLCRVLQLYGTEVVVAVGKFCETRTIKALKRYLPQSNVKVVYLPHPSPRVVNNNNWSEKALERLRDHNLLQYYTRDPEPLDLTT